jgi:cyanophycinase-like exopeptidase
VTRDRMGRMNTFMARILKDIDQNPPSLSRAVGIDEHTALLLDPKTGDLTTVGVGTAYICDSSSPATVCKSETPLTFQGFPSLFVFVQRFLSVFGVGFIFLIFPLLFLLRFFTVFLVT